MTDRRARTRRIWLALAVAALSAGCGKHEGGDAAAPREAVVVTVAKTPVPLTVELPGRLDAYRQAEVRARVAGIVTARTYEEGQEVKRGAVLFRIDPAPFKAARDAAAGALEKAQAAYLAAQDKRRRYDDLVRDRAVSERDHTEALADERQARAAVASARAELARAQLQLGYASVTAPIDGRARRALVTEGALVGQDQATPLTTVEQLDPIYVNFSQPAAEVEALRRAVKSGRAAGIAQQDVEVTLIRPDGSVYERKGKLLFADLAVDPSTDTVAMRALFPNPERELLPGAYVRLALDRAIEREAVLVPRDALLRTADGASVKVVDANGKVRDVAVDASRMKGGDWIVTRGLAGGERVVVSDAAQFDAGASVKAIERAAAARPASAPRSI
ncbi:MULTISPECIES: MexX/AxyX family multidrug efflux RND transporter periplasmic adaptor subunit [Burkholderia]|uniref:MexX/AxyX family multidrug efflux RND transporter periplasmic adaptor subunit n=1 Tax=Burkholderia TaxID=32008 RepID=UPI000841874E|nr:MULTISPECIES: MexX/AxyX family multidrug efflux RND transporter periplasmic adaptor subunit [unclassified Burkholderia]AOK29825.1 multidrug transporter [Burkholderia sp. Bp7605]